MDDLITDIQYIKLGLQYHYNNYIDIESQLNGDLNNEDRHKIIKLNNEVIAYFNRLGQFYYLAKSEKVNKFISDINQQIPLTNKFIIFRMKQSAHRATDYPRGEILENMQQLDRLFTYQSILLNNNLFYQVLLDKPGEDGRMSVNFTMRQDHPLILTEIERFIEQLKNSI